MINNKTDRRYMLKIMILTNNSRQTNCLVIMFRFLLMRKHLFFIFGEYSSITAVTLSPLLLKTRRPVCLTFAATNNWGTTLHLVQADSPVAVSS